MNDDNESPKTPPDASYEYAQKKLNHLVPKGGLTGKMLQDQLGKEAEAIRKEKEEKKKLKPQIDELARGNTHIRSRKEMGLPPAGLNSFKGQTELSPDAIEIYDMLDDLKAEGFVDNKPSEQRLNVRLSENQKGASLSNERTDSEALLVFSKDNSGQWKLDTTKDINRILVKVIRGNKMTPIRLNRLKDEQLENNMQFDIYDGQDKVASLKIKFTNNRKYLAVGTK